MQKWQSWLSKLALLLEIRIPRDLFSDILGSTKVELQGFCDSSTQSYAAVSYVRVFDSSSQRYKCRIVAAKLKVAHVKQLTILCLELSGCLLLSKLISNIFPALTKCHLITCINCWTDSTVALNWIKNISKTREKWVESRLTTIRNLVNESYWLYSLSNSNYFTSAKKCRRESCIIDFTSAKMEFASAIFKKMYFSKYSIKYVVNRLPPFKNFYDHTNRLLKG